MVNPVRGKFYSVRIKLQMVWDSFASATQTD
jgi:hypothetical protein